MQSVNPIDILNTDRVQDTDDAHFDYDLNDSVNYDEEGDFEINHDLSPNSLNILSLNVCGIKSKLRNGAFELFAKNFDILCLTETKTNSPDLSNSCLNNFKVISLMPKSRGNKLGGFHGISVLLREKYANHCKQLDYLSSPSTLWLSFSGNIFSVPFILGVTYIPGENSTYYDKEIFNTLSEDLLIIKEQYDVPICTVRDLNSRTGALDDFFTIDDHVAKSVNLDIIDTEFFFL